MFTSPSLKFRSMFSHRQMSGDSRRAYDLSFVALLLLLVSGCATYQSNVESSRTALASHNPDKAVKDLAPLAEKDGKDQLVYMLDYATALQLAGNYKESAKMLGRAEKIADIQDYT